MNVIALVLGTTIGRYALVAIGGLIGLWAFGLYKERTGYNACKAEWTAAEQAAIKRGEDARDRAKRDVLDGVLDPYDRPDL